jgi:hypothetical protein
LVLQDAESSLKALESSESSKFHLHQAFPHKTVQNFAFILTLPANPTEIFHQNSTKPESSPWKFFNVHYFCPSTTNSSILKRANHSPLSSSRDFSKIDMPVVAKIVKGQHLNLGVPSLSNPNLQSTALFLNAGKKYQIIAQPIKIKEGRKATNVGEIIDRVTSRIIEAVPRVMGSFPVARLLRHSSRCASLGSLPIDFFYLVA